MIPFSPLSIAGAAAKQVFALLLLLTTLTPLVASHAIRATPIPYGSPHQKNGPIDGTNFPCQGGAGANYQLPASGYNIFPLGSKQPLVLQGTAVHGGGSCQISITYDNPPTPQSKFKVIKSIEGGCIARNEAGNRPGDSADEVNPDSYEYVIPDDIPTGNGTIAWTWFNKIGNREMYMACGGVQLTGTEKPGAKETFEKLPDIFMANIGNGCGTPDSKDVLFPNPGKYVEKANGKTEAFATPTGQGCQKPTGGGAGGAGGGTATSSAAGGAVTNAPYPVANKTVTVSVTGAPTGSNTFPAGVFITKSSVDDGAPVATGAASAPPVSSVSA
ncbi:hypothetical protein N0V85_002764, partial [Neurospora sp. IMI 360204]